MDYKVLVVDDNKLNSRILQDILQDEGYEVFTQNEGKGVVEKAQNNKVDAILLDIIMPETDGFEVCRLLKENHTTKNIPIIMVTARTDGKDLKKAFGLGAFDYVKKPFNEMEVLVRLNSAIRYKEQQEKLRVMAMKDGLTGLYNHSLLVDLFEKEYSKAQRKSHGIAFLMIDVDHYKRVNDTYGHTVGDEVLRSLAKILKQNLRQSDIIGRYGGEEFGTVLEEITFDEARYVCERIRRSVENNIFNVDNHKVKITVSIGMCYKYSSDNDVGYQTMIIKADKALYNAKENGRNRVEYIKLLQ